jgi:mRNA interferase HicA
MKCNEALKILQDAGLTIHSQRGSHVKLKHPHFSHIIVFPNHGSKELGKGLMHKLFKQAGI